MTSEANKPEQSTPEPNQSGANKPQVSSSADKGGFFSVFSRLKSNFRKYLLGVETQKQIGKKLEEVVKKKVDEFFTDSQKKETIEKLESDIKKEIIEPWEKQLEQLSNKSEELQKEISKASVKVNSTVIILTALGAFTVLNRGPILDILSIDVLRREVEELKQLEGIQS
ncbi:MAG: hypothetical protein TH68_03895, partial [Candidatus Synechococcus spongiarum 142]